MGDREGPVGTVETESSVQSSGLTRLHPINQSMNADRQETLVRFDPSSCSLTILRLFFCVLEIFHLDSSFSFIYGCQIRGNTC